VQLSASSRELLAQFGHLVLKPASPQSIELHSIPTSQVRLMIRILVSPLACANPPLGLKYGCAFSSDQAGARPWHGKN
jgi:hypothetical protein